MSLSPRRLLRPWRKKSFSSIKPRLSEEETMSTVDYGGKRSKQNHDIRIIVATQREELQLGELQEEISSWRSITSDSRREQAEAAWDQHFETMDKQVEQRQCLVSQRSDQESKPRESLDEESASPYVHEIKYTYKADKRPMEDRNIKELFNEPPPDGNNLRTVQELLEGSNSLPPWLRDMLLEASMKGKQIPYSPNSANVSKPLSRCESADSTSAGFSEAGEEATTVMSSFSDQSEMMEDYSNVCNLFPIYF
jgi:hypothetical protein